MRSWIMKKLGISESGLETEFLPAALEVTETPPSPIGRAILLVIMFFAVFAICWACLGKTDVVAIASGKIIPSGKVKTIQLLEIGVIRRIAVEEGQHVNKGDILIEMDTTSTQASIEQLERDSIESQYELARINALLKWEPEGTDLPRLILPDTTSPALQDVISVYHERVREDAETLRSQLTVLNSEIKQHNAKLAAASFRVEKLSKLLPISEKWARSLKKLYDDGMGSEYDWLVRESERITAEQDLREEKQHVEEIRAAIQSSNKRKQQAIAVFRKDLLDKKSNTTVLLEKLTQELVKARRVNTLKNITAPVSGRVQQLAAHTVGGVINEAEPVMVIVPDDCKLEVEAQILNKDVGFVHAGQQAEIKIEAFPYTQYGTIDGKVKSISGDAIQIERQGLVYLGRFELEKDRLTVDGNDVILAPGMAVTAEVKIRQRRLIEFFLSPLLKYSDESLRER